MSVHFQGRPDPQPILHAQNVQEGTPVEFQLMEEPGRKLPTQDKVKDDMQLTRGEKAVQYLKLTGKGSLAALGSIGLTLWAVPHMMIYQFLVICPGIDMKVSDAWLLLFFKGFDVMWSKALDREKAPEKTKIKIEEVKPNQDHPPIGIPNGGVFIEPKNLNDELNKKDPIHRRPEEGRELTPADQKRIRDQFEKEAAELEEMRKEVAAKKREKLELEQNNNNNAQKIPEEKDDIKDLLL